MARQAGSLASGHPRLSGASKEREGEGGHWAYTARAPDKIKSSAS